MPKHRFFTLNDIAEKKIVVLDETQTRHALQVLRMKLNDSIGLVNGQGDYAEGDIVEIGKKTCTISITSYIHETRLHPYVHIVIPPLKNTSRLEWFLEKASEIGVAEISLLITERTEKEKTRMDRLEQIIVSATLQSQQLYKPILNAPTLYNKFIDNLSFNGNRLIAHCLPNKKNDITTFRMQDSIIFIGPEGDFTEQEIQWALERNFTPVSLGNSRLRTETAGVVAAAALLV